MKWPAQWGRLRELVDEHYDSVYRYAYRLTGAAADAEDLTQDAFAKAQMHWGQLRVADRAKGWLFAIVRNGFLQKLRGEHLRRTVPLDAVGDLSAPAERGGFAIEADELQQALNELPEPFRAPVILFYFEEFSYREIAEHLDVPIGTVMSRLARAKAHLRRRLEASEPDRRLVHELP